MLVCLLAKMLQILVLCPVLLIAGVQTLTIDSQLGTSIEDCFERISIGEHLPNSAIYRNVSELTTRECEQICKQDKQCQVYDYGVGAKGNATCNLSIQSEREVKENSLLSRHPDYDVYVRRFQCEQAPPTPIQPLLDDTEDSPASNDRPLHRPVFRPDVDESPLADDYLVSSDIDPYNNEKPYRPDDIFQRPVFDVGPSYGDHKPQEIPYPERPRPDPYRPDRPNDPYRPDKPNYPYRPDRPDPYRPGRPNHSYWPEKPGPYKPDRPQDPYRPERPDPYRPHDAYPHKPKPESNDVLHFDGYGKPRPDYPLDRPDPYRPYKPNYNYIIRPNKIPRPEDEHIKPIKPLDPINDGQYGHISGPIGPPYKPNRPEKPTYSYNTQYASNYGQNTQNDNSVYVEIYDPPRPYIPIRDRPVQQNYDQGFLGYGTYSSQNTYAQSSQTQNTYSGTITEIGYDHDRPYVKPQKPGGHDEPGYGNKPSSVPNTDTGSYQSQNGQGDYGFNGNNRPIVDHQHTGYQRPNDRYKPQASHNSYGGSQHSYNQNSYGSSQSEHQSSYGSSYGESHRPSHNQDHGESDYQKPQKPSYNKPSGGDKGDYGGSYGGNQGSYGGNQGSYGGNQGSYGGNQGSYGGNQDYYNSNKGSTTQSSYGTVQSSYGNTQGSYGQGSYSQGSYGSHSYGTQSYGSQGGYGNSQGMYGSGGSYGGNQASYGSNQGSYGSYDSTYGHSTNGHGNRPVYDYETHKPGYGNQNPEYHSQKPGYGGQKPDYDQKPGYGNEKPDYDQKPGYGKPDYDQKPGYGNQKPDYDQKPGYGNQKPDYDQKPGYGSQKPDYDQTPGYGNQKPDYDQKPGYGNQKPDYDQKPGYGNQKPDYDGKPGYGNQKPDYDQKPGYGNQKPDYDQKPGYGNERPDPVYGSAQPDSGYGKPSYSSDKLDHATQKPGYGNEKPGYGSQRPDVKPVYEYELDKPTNVPTYISRPGGEVVTSRPVVIGDYERPVYKDPGMQSFAACYRRVLAGRRALRSFVRKVVPCERLEDCRRECALEKRFPCESFNYRLDQSFRGKGLCELMTKPIEAFDQQRDFVDDKNYDFYEVDRNSLEPNCPETLRGQGLLHSGFLSSKPDRIDHGGHIAGHRPDRVDHRPNRVDQSGWRDRHDWGGGYDRNRYSFEDRRSSSHQYRGGNRRYEDHFVPYQIGQSRTTDDEDNSSWGQYGGNYGGQYYKDSNDYHKSIDHWGLTIDRPTPVKPYFDSRKSHGFNYHSLGKNLNFDLSINDFRDIQVDHSGGRYGYGAWKRGRWDSSGVKNTLDFDEYEGVERRDEDHESHSGSHDGGGNECISSRRPGMSLKSGAIRRSLAARDVVQCEAACFGEREFKCVSYSYRYSTSRGTDNCFLSERPYRGLEMSADSGSDVYGMPQDKGCSASNRPWVESECFWHVRSDTAVSGSAAKATLTVAGLGACEAECIRAQGFFCRGFSFRFDPPTIGDEDIHNCILTSSPTTRLSRTDTAGHELYARGNYGRGCEPAVYDDTQNGECYLQYDKAAKLTGAAVRGQARVKDEQTCGTACTEAPFRCLSFSFNNNAPPSTDNCLLSDIRLFDLQKGVDYVHSVDDWLFAFDLFNSRCWRKVHAEDHSSELPHPIIPSSGEEHFHGGPSGPSGPSGHPSGPDYLPDSQPDIPYILDSGPPSGPSGPSGPTGPYKPFSKPEPYRPTYETNGPSSPEKIYPIEPYRPSRPFISSKPDHRPNFRPDPEIYTPGFRPPDSNNPNFRPPEVIIPYKPEYPDPEPYRPGFGPQTEPRPGYRPEPRPGYNLEPRPGYNPEPRPGFRPDPPSYRPEPDRPFRPTEIYPKPDPGFKPGVRPGDRPGVRPGLDTPGYLPEGRPQKPVFQGDRENGPIESSWRHYTVSGFPCRAGTTCAQNQIAGHWACEPEGGEIGSWDYCCAPTHRCGYSEGFHKPWCYVGHKDDQWRPCSEKYYPYHHHSEPHPSQGHRESPRPHRPWRDLPSPPRNSPWAVKAVSPPPPDYTPHWDKPPGPYLSEADRKYWDDLYEHGPKAYYDTYGNPLPGYSRVPTESRPYIRYKHNRPSIGPSPGQLPEPDGPPPVPGLGAPRYWPVAYLHRGPPPNMTYFRYNETKHTTPDRHHTTTTPPSRDLPESRDDDDGQTIDDDDYKAGDRKSNDSSRNNGNSRSNVDYSRDNNDSSRGNDDKSRSYTDNTENSRGSNNNSRKNDSSRVNDKPRNGKRDEDASRDEKKINDSKTDNAFSTNIDKTTAKSITTETPLEKLNNSDVELVKPEDFQTIDSLKGIDDKLDDFSKSIEVLDIEDAKGEKLSDLKTLEAEERQIEAIGRLLASRRGTKIVLEKRSQKDLDTQSIAVDKDIIDFNFGNRFPTTERRGVIKRISKDEIERDRVDKSLEVSETTFVRPPRVLSTTENIRKAIVNGKVFYDATIREQRDLFSNNTRKPKNLRRTDNTTPSVINNNNFGRKKIIRTRNANPVRRVKRLYRKRYNPGEVRRRLLERDRSKNNTESSRSR